MARMPTGSCRRDAATGAREQRYDSCSGTAIGTDRHQRSFVGGSGAGNLPAHDRPQVTIS
jgi:hypothetical protein